MPSRGSTGADSPPVTKAKYDGLAEWYDDEQSWVAARPDAPRERFADLAEPADALIVEIGCGTGLAAAALRARGWQVGGIDVSWNQLEIARAATGPCRLTLTSCRYAARACR
jgi:predicted TPR repeat methyltransferase